MVTPAANPLDKIIRGILKLLGQLLREKAHAQIIITVRDGNIHLVTETRTFKPDNLPES
jgi:hypothetical protein